ncbi:serine hydrolase domain-containing protein [Agromyces neolithicus]|uniref:Serine hydrolase domain-containing protein n=1 Tax=Agromyces neolithicus TaxID=269420 RepID=A0ABN2MCA0_9MICO
MQTIEGIDAFLKAEFAASVAKRGVPGSAIAVLKDGEIIEAAAGVLSLDTRVETTTDTVFQIGSITKVWTATLVMQLVDDGLLDLDAPIQQYLPEFRLLDEASAASITTRQLLSHQGGFEGDVFTDTGRGDDAIEKFVEQVAGLPQLFPPGELFSYNNVAYIVLGRLVEVLRDSTWEAVLLERIAGPLGFDHVSPSPYEAIQFRAAMGHLGEGDEVVPAPFWASARSNEPAGSMLAMTAGELLGFARMHLDAGVGADGTRVLSEASAREMREPQVHLPVLVGMPAAWGLGWEVVSTESPVVIGHDGTTIGQAAFLRIVPEAGLAVVLLTNGGDVFGLFDDVVRPLLRGVAGAELPTFPLPPAEPIAVEIDGLVGSYASSIFEMNVSVDADGRIWLDRIPSEAVAEMGEKPSRDELVGFNTDSLIQLEATSGLHPVYAFLGDAGGGKRKYLHYGRAVARSA